MNTDQRKESAPMSKPATPSAGKGASGPVGDAELDKVLNPGKKMGGSGLEREGSKKAY